MVANDPSPWSADSGRSLAGCDGSCGQAWGRGFDHGWGWIRPDGTGLGMKPAIPILEQMWGSPPSDRIQELIPWHPKHR